MIFTFFILSKVIEINNRDNNSKILFYRKQESIAEYYSENRLHLKRLSPYLSVIICCERNKKKETEHI